MFTYICIYIQLWLYKRDTDLSVREARKDNEKLMREQRSQVCVLSSCVYAVININNVGGA